MIALAFLYRYVASRHGVSCGLASALWFCLTGAYYYGSEARPYAIVLACSSVALWSWDRVATVPRRAIHVVLFGAALAIAIASHFYAILLLVPFGIGELVRLYERRRIDWPIVAALAFPTASIALHLPAMLAVTDLRSGFYNPAGWRSMPQFLFLAFGEAGVWLLVACVVCLYIGKQERRTLPPQNSAPPHYSRDASAVLVSLTSLPLLAILLGLLYTNAFVPRYVISSLVGLSALLPALLYARLERTSSWRPALILLLFAGFIAVRVIPTVQNAFRHESPEAMFAKDLPTTAVGSANEPIVVASPFLFPVLSQYAPPLLRTRLVYLADPGNAVRFAGTNTPDLSLITLIPWSDLHIESYESFVSEHDSFFIMYLSADRFQWLISKLRADGRGVVSLTQQGRYAVSQCCR